MFSLLLPFHVSSFSRRSSLPCKLIVTQASVNISNSHQCQLDANALLCADCNVATALASFRRAEPHTHLIRAMVSHALPAVPDRLHSVLRQFSVKVVDDQRKLILLSHCVAVWKPKHARESVRFARMGYCNACVTRMGVRTFSCCGEKECVFPCKKKKKSRTMESINHERMRNVIDVGGYAKYDLRMHAIVTPVESIFQLE